MTVKRPYTSDTPQHMNTLYYKLLIISCFLLCLFICTFSSFPFFLVFFCFIFTDLSSHPLPVMIYPIVSGSALQIRVEHRSLPATNSIFIWRPSFLLTLWSECHLHSCGNTACGKPKLCRLPGAPWLLTPVWLLHNFESLFLHFPFACNVNLHLTVWGKEES